MVSVSGDRAMLTKYRCVASKSPAQIKRPGRAFYQTN